MKKSEVQKLRHGLYEVFWKESAGGGNSLAAVGSLYNGDRWFALSNWTSANSKGIATSSMEHWHKVDRVRLLKLSDY